MGDFSVLDAAERHFAARRELKRIEVKEWQSEDGAPGEVFYYDPPNVYERNKVLRYLDPETGAIDPDGQLACFMVRARKSDGSPLVSPATWDKSFERLSKTIDPAVLTKIVAKMGGAVGSLGGLSLEDAEKNSATGPETS